MQKRAYQKMLVKLFFLLFLLTGCGTSQNNNIYNDFIAGLSETAHYSIVQLNQCAYPVLLVTDNVYEFSDEVRAAVSCNIYYIKDGKAVKIDTISSQGTGYPITWDANGIYAAGHHYAGRYSIDEELSKLKIEEYALEEFETGKEDARYTYTSENETIQVNSREKLNALFEKYDKASVVNFMNESK